MEAVRTSEMYVYFNDTTQLYIPEDYSFCKVNQSHNTFMEEQEGNRGIAPLIHDLGTRWE
jgi:hypothetical protein